MERPPIAGIIAGSPEFPSFQCSKPFHTYTMSKVFRPPACGEIPERFRYSIESFITMYPPRFVFPPMSFIRFFFRLYQSKYMTVVPVFHTPLARFSSRNLA